MSAPLACQTRPVARAPAGPPAHLAVDAAATLHHVAGYLQVVVHHGLHQRRPLLLVYRVDVGSRLQGGRTWAGAAEGLGAGGGARAGPGLTCSSTWQISTEPFWAAACRGVRLLC